MLIEIKEIARTNPTARGVIPKICVLKCDACDVVFERNFSYRKLNAHYCSSLCSRNSRKVNSLGSRGGEVIESTCMTCDKHMSYRKIGNERKWGKTCSRKCYGVYRSEHPELYVANTNSMHTSESHQKISLALKENSSQPGWTAHWQGRKHSTKTIEKIRQTKRNNPPIGSKNGMFGRRHTQVARDAMSDKHTLAIVTGVRRVYGKNNHHHGDYVSIKTSRTHHYRSSWELATMKWLDVDESVTTWNYECQRIPYTYNENKRWYVPDFLIEFSDGHKEMWEIKPKEFVESSACKLKTQAAQAFCSSNVIDLYVILTKNDLVSRGIL